MSAPELRIGITTRDDRPALELCLKSIAQTVANVENEVVVVDCQSADGSAEMATEAGAKVLVRGWTQAESLNYLLGTSRSKYTLLLHSDIVLLDEDWYRRLAEEATASIALVAPDDSGLGPHLRSSYGSGHPESSFLFWRTDLSRSLRALRLREFPRRLRARLPLARTLELSDKHVTHRLADNLIRCGLEWRPMTVLASPQTAPWYHHRVRSGANWDADWSTYEYGFGNFYALGGRVTHYHQWYTRFSGLDRDALNDDGVPARFLAESAARFRADYLGGHLKLPRQPA